MKCLKKKNEPAKTLTKEEETEFAELTKEQETNRLILIKKQFVAILIKRFHRVKRNFKGFLAEIILPVIFVCLALLISSIIPGVRNRPALELHPWYYNTPNQIFISKTDSLTYEVPVYDSETSYSYIIDSNEESNVNKVNQIINTFYTPSSLGTRCMDGHRIRLTNARKNYEPSLVDGDILACESFDFKVVQNYTLPSVSIINELAQTNYSYSKVSIDCDCSSGFPECPSGAGGDIDYRPIIKSRTMDTIYDLTSRNITDWLIKTQFNEKFFRKRFGGYEFYVSGGLQANNDLTDLQTQIETLLQLFGVNFSGFSLESFVARDSVRIWYNPKGFDSSVSYLNVINNAFLRSKLPADTLGQHGIVAFNHPMKFTQGQFFRLLEDFFFVDTLVGVFIIFALSFIPVSFLVAILEERETHAKQLQFVSGVKPYIYWMSTFTWDLMNYAIPALLCILLFILFQIDSYISGKNFPTLIILIFLYGWACIPLMYPLNYLFKLPSTAFVACSTINVFVGSVTVISTTVLEQLALDDDSLEGITEQLKNVFVVLFPQYCLGGGLITMATGYNLVKASKSFGLPREFDPLSFENVGKNLLALTIQGFVFFALNLLIEYNFFIRFKATSNLAKLNLPEKEDEDSDVKAEQDRISSNQATFKSNKKAGNIIQILYF